MCATYPSVVVLQALLLTAAITLALTGYTFWATHNGKEFDFLGPWLFSTLVALVVVSLLAMFLPLGSGAQLALAFVGAVLFSACASKSVIHAERVWLQRTRVPPMLLCSHVLPFPPPSLATQTLCMIRSRSSSVRAPTRRMRWRTQRAAAPKNLCCPPVALR